MKQPASSPRVAKSPPKLADQARTPTRKPLREPGGITPAPPKAAPGAGPTRSALADTLHGEAPRRGLTDAPAPAPTPRPNVSTPQKPTASPTEPMRVSRPDSAPEQEAERNARTPGNKPAAGPALIHAAGEPIPPAVESYVRDARGRGRRLPADLRAEFEARFGRPLTDIRLHDDAAAASAAEALRARAFTAGKDIFFARGEYQPDTDAGKRLLTHEITHTLQQPASGGVTTIFRAPAGQAEAAPADTKTGEPPAPKTGGFLTPEQLDAARKRDPAGGQLVEDQGGARIVFATLAVPAFKLAAHRGPLYQSRRLRRSRGYDRTGDNNANQQAIWAEHTAAAAATAIEAKLKTSLEQAKIYPPGAIPAKLALKTSSRHAGVTSGRGQLLVGDLTTLSGQLLTPTWTKSGKPFEANIDHIVELQVASWPEDKTAGAATNLELLNAALNKSSGAVVMNGIQNQVVGFLRGIGKEAPDSKANVGRLKQTYDLEFNKAVPAADAKAPDSPDDYFWTAEDIIAGAHVEKALALKSLDRPLQWANPSALTDADPNKFRVFPSEVGGVAKTFTLSDKIDGSEANWLKPFVLVGKTLDPDKRRITALTFTLGPHVKKIWSAPEAEPIEVEPFAERAGFVRKPNVKKKLWSRTEVKKASPVDFTDLDIDPERGLVAGGVIKPSLSVLAGSMLSFELSGNSLAVVTALDASILKVPRPLKITTAMLALGASEEAGLFFDGSVDFEIEGIGAGYIRGGLAADEHLNFEGQFAFDSKTFTPAEVRVNYQKGQWSGGGKLGIGKGKIRGVRSALLDVAYDGSAISAAGSADLDIPGIQQAKLHARHSPKDGLEIGGSVELAELPGIKSGSLQLDLKRRPGGDWSISGRGRATPNIPGFDTSFAIEYDDGRFKAEATAEFSRGRLAGKLHAGVTNALAGAGPVPPEGPATGPLRVFGDGQLTLTVAPWLKGSAAVRLLDNGELEVVGEIGLPSTLQVFEQRKLEKQLVSVGVDIPILGVAVAGARVGVFANITGGLDFLATIGPGELRELKLGIQYNPSREQDTHVYGAGVFAIPAYAGLRLFVRGGVGVGAGISATGSLEVSGTLGIEGLASAAASLDWRPDSGLALAATGKLSATPMFRFGVDGLVQVEAKAFGVGVTLYEQRWKLASFEYGSGLALGITFPVRYTEGTPFQIALSDIEVQKPDIDVRALLAGLVDKVVSG